MTPTDFNTLPGGPPLPDGIDPTDPMRQVAAGANGVERWLMEASAHAYQVVRSTTPVQSRGRTVQRPNFTKQERKRWGMSLKWPQITARFDYDESFRFHLDLKPVRGSES